jgi:hypothetical protein
VLGFVLPAFWEFDVAAVDVVILWLLVGELRGKSNNGIPGAPFHLFGSREVGT